MTIGSISNATIQMPNIHTPKTEIETLFQEGDRFTSYHDMKHTYSQRWYERNKDLVKSIVETPTGEMILPAPKGEVELAKYSDVFQPYGKDLGVITHGASEETCQQIMKDGFKIKKDSWVETIRGIYFTVENEPNNYGAGQIEAEFKGKVFSADTNKILQFKYQRQLSELLTQKGLTSNVPVDEVMMIYIKDQMASKGIDGFVSKEMSTFAKCKYFVTDKLDLIKILKYFKK